MSTIPMTVNIPKNLKISLCLVGTVSVSSLSLAEDSVILFIGAFIAIWSVSFMPKVREYFKEDGVFTRIFPALCIALMIGDYFYLSGKVVLALLHFLILYEIFLFLSCNSEKRVWQIYLVSFLTVAVSASITDNFYFSFSFIFYVIAAIYSLILFRIFAEGTEKLRLNGNIISGEDVGYPSQYVIGKKTDKNILVVVVTAFIVTIIFTSLFFLTLPRIGLGFMLSRIGAASGIAGFSEQSRIGDIGEVLTNRNIVMRIKTSKPISYSDLRMRGIAYDFFRDNIWKRSRMFNRFYKPFYSERVNLLRDNKLTSENRIVQSVALALNGSDALFSLYFPVSVKNMSGGYRGILGDDSMSLFTPWPHYYLVNYEVESISDEGIFYRELTPVEMKHYLDTQGLDEKVRALASTVAGSSGDFYVRALRLQNYLSSNMKYSRKMDIVGYNEDPIYNFLFNTKKGHCEYFASALTLMCRSVGIPARYVNGFYGGEWNDYGNYYIVRQENAHSWTEVFVPGRGWIYLDATPVLDDRKLSASFFSSIALFIDNIKMSWGKYIVGYDLNMQAKAAEKMNLNALQWIKKIEAMKNNIPRPDIFKAKGLLIILLSLMLIFICFVFLLKKETNGKKKYYSVGFYRNLIKIFEKNGYVKPYYLTGFEFINSLEDLHPNIQSESLGIVSFFYNTKYGKKSIAEEDESEINEKLKKIQQLFKEEK